jgi:hypothetical protein
MKKRLLFFMTLFWSVWSFGQNVGDSFTSGDIVYNITSTSPATVEVGFNTFNGPIANIPSMVTYAGTDYSVTSIGIQAFNGTGLTSVIIPDSVTSIGAFAFAGTPLISVTIPNSVISIGSDAFANNEYLTSVILGNSLTSINSWVFSNCPNLTSVTIPNSVTSIGSFAFLNTGLTSLTIPNSVTSIGVSAFEGCLSLTTVTIPDSVISIGISAFYSCTSLTSLTIPNSVTSIEEYAFGNCLSLNSVTVNWASPLPINANVFQNTPISSATLIVPAQTKALYQVASVWQNFGSIFEPATHLNFDGVNDRVELPNESNFDFTSTFSMEAWIRVTSFTQEWQTVISKGAEGPRIHRFGVSDFIAFGTGPSNDLVSTVSVNDGNWHHIAATCNNGFKSLYVDGVLQGTQNVGTPLVTNNDNVRIGSQIDSYSPIRAFHGDIDDVRIWNVARTAEQINGSRNCELQGTEAGLVANYKFNQGLDAADNTSITTLTDATANANNGTLVNFTKTGTTSNFLAGSPVTTGSIIPSVATVTTPVTYNQGATATALTATVGANGSNLVWYTTATGGTGATTAPTPDTTNPGNTSYWVASTNANGCESARTEIVVTVNASIPATHLNFDGTNDYVTSGNILPSSYTKEAMIFLVSNTGSNNIISGSDSAGQHAFWVPNMRLSAGHNGNWGSVQDAVNLALNTWYHVAVSYDSATQTLRLYKNGVLISTATNIPAPINGNQVLIGSYDNGNLFNGNMDEVRIWNKVLTATDIMNHMNCELQSAETGLVAYYQFNQGNDSADNTTITTLTDASGNANNGTLTNFARTGTTSNFLMGSPIVTGTTCTTLNTTSFEIANNIKMYPNPTNNFVMVAVNNLTNAKLQVLDITGKILMNQVLNTSSNTIDVQQLPTGMYLFKVSSNEGTTTSKIVKQ